MLRRELSPTVSEELRSMLLDELHSHSGRISLRGVDATSIGLEDDVETMVGQQLYYLVHERDVSMDVLGCNFPGTTSVEIRYNNIHSKLPLWSHLEFYL